MKNFYLKTFSVALLFLLLPIMLLGWDQKLIDIANKFAKGDSITNGQKAYLFANNTRLNNLAGRGVISNAVYQKNQSYFQNLNDRFSKAAAMKSGLVLNKQTSLATKFKPWTDTDNLIGKEGGKIKLQDIKNVRGNYNQMVKNWLTANGMKVKDGIDWAKKNDTDFMPHANQTKQFARINKWINKMGGTAYESPAAANVEKYIRSGKLNKINTRNATIYNQEMNSQIDHKTKMINSTNKAIAKLQAKSPQPGTKAYTKLQDLKATNQALKSQVAKYLVRKNTINNIVSQKYGVGQQTNPPKRVLQVAENRGLKTTRQANYVGRNAKTLMQNADKNFHNTLSQIPKTQIAKEFIRSKAIGVFGQKPVNLVSSPDKNILKPLGYQRSKPGTFNRKLEGYGSGMLKAGGFILLAFKVYDVVKEAYQTGNYAQGAANLVILGVVGYGMNYAITTVFGGFLAANPATAVAIGTFTIAYGLTREIFSRVEIGGKTLDQHTQDIMDKYYFKSGQYDEEAKKQIIKMYFDAIAKGHKLQDGMSPEEGLKKLLENYDKGGKIFVGIFEPRTGAANTIVENSTIINTIEGSAEASGKSKINTGISAVNAKIEDSYIENVGDVEAVAKENSRINTGVSLNQSTVQRSFISTRTEGKVEAVNNSVINIGLSANNSEIKDANITSDVEGTFTARDSSNINAGIQANRAKISNANISNTVQGANVTAKNRSTVNQGTKFDKEANEQDTNPQFNFGK